MSGDVGPGTTIRFGAPERTATVVRLLGEGGQGAVYEVATNAGERLALKWYLPHSATSGQRQSILDLVERGAPNERFLWPIDLVEGPDESSFGYVMHLRPPEFVGLAALLGGGVDASLRTICTIGLELADAFLRIHAQGLCYRDISLGNIFFDPLSGSTLICDNDNVGIEGRTPPNVLGTRRFIAPEIVRREAHPSTATDLYSLAVLLFYLLMVGHPLLGRRELGYPLWDERAESDLFGVDPLFVFDPLDESNRPVPGIHDAVLANWDVYPVGIRALFERAFTTGLTDPSNGRVKGSQWRAELARIRDLVGPCPRCGASWFYDERAEGQTCWNCHAGLQPPLRMVLDGAGSARTVVLSEETVLTPHHLDGSRYQFAPVLGRVQRHPHQRDRWGLLNSSESEWRVDIPNGSTTVLTPGRTISLIAGSRIAFGTTTGILRFG